MTKPQFQIISMQAIHWDEVHAIYKKGIETGIATFESVVPTYEEWDNTHLKSCRLIAMDGESVIGWAALSPVSSRCVYGGVAEVSVYVSPGHGRRGIGIALLNALIIESENNNLWMLNASIMPDNIYSIKLHEKASFRKIGYKEKVGKISYGPNKGKWIDNILFEKRSAKVGI